jgi:signal transduction histidine kinase
MPVAPHRTPSKSYRAMRASLFASLVLSCVGLFTASAVGDQTPPYDESLASEVAWGVFIGFGAASLLLGAIVSVWSVRNANRSELALDAKAAEVADLRASRGRLVADSDATRRRIERDLHDGVQPRLVALLLNVKLARRQPLVEREASLLETIELELAEILRDLRALASGILPPALTDLGLEAAVTELTAKMPFRVEVAVPEKRLPEPVEVTAYFVIAEALTNAAKHAQASRVTVRMDLSGERAVVEVHDDGRGGAEAFRGSGLRGLADRVDSLEGQLSVTSRNGAGTTVRAVMPCV